MEDIENDAEKSLQQEETHDRMAVHRPVRNATAQDEESFHGYVVDPVSNGDGTTITVIDGLKTVGFQVADDENLDVTVKKLYTGDKVVKIKNLESQPGTSNGILVKNRPRKRRYEQSRSATPRESKAKALKIIRGLLNPVKSTGVKTPKSTREGSKLKRKSSRSVRSYKKQCECNKTAFRYEDTSDSSSTDSSVCQGCRRKH